MPWKYSGRVVVVRQVLNHIEIWAEGDKIAVHEKSGRNHGLIRLKGHTYKIIPKWYNGASGMKKQELGGTVLLRKKKSKIEDINELATKKERSSLNDDSSIAFNQTPKLMRNMMLTLTLEQKMTYSDELINELQKKLDALPPIQIGEVNIFPVEAGQLDNGGYYANVFIRNAGDLMLDLSINAITLFLIDATGEKAAGGVFQIENFQSIKFGEARYWTFAWRAEEVLKKDADLSKFDISFS